MEAEQLIDVHINVLKRNVGQLWDFAFLNIETGVALSHDGGEFFLLFFSSRKCYHIFKISFTSISNEISFIPLIKLEKNHLTKFLIEKFNLMVPLKIFLSLCLPNKTTSKVKNNLLCPDLLNYLIPYKCLEPLDFHHCVTVFMVLF